MKKYQVQTEKDSDGNLLVKLPKQLLKSLGWKEGTEVDVTTSDGQIYVRKATGEKNQ